MLKCRQTAGRIPRGTWPKAITGNPASGDGLMQRTDTDTDTEHRRQGCAAIGCCIQLDGLLAARRYGL